MRNRLKKIIFCLCAAMVLNAAVAQTLLIHASEYRDVYEPVGFTEEEEVFLAQAENALKDILDKKDIMALVYLTDSYPVKSQANNTSETVIEVTSGQQVWIENVVLNPVYEAWVQVFCNVRGTRYTGYINRTNLACSDEDFLNWEIEYGMNPAMYQTMMMTTEGSDGAEESGDSEDAGEQQLHPDIELFPESYQEALYALKEAHPSWVFVKMNTGLDWDTVVAEELKGGRSLVHGSNKTAMKEGLFGQNWYYATEEALEYYLDPRNGLTEEWIFQFEQLTFNESYHTKEALQLFLDNTFMKGNIPQTVMTYALGLTAIGKEFQVSPFHLASRIYQEQGNGTSALISGTYPGYEGYYNYYNIGATGSSDKEVIENGLKYAKSQGWNSPYNSLHFGAKLITANYIAKGQDTLYLQKFDVDSSDGELYWHQYMQNIGAPSNEGKNIRKQYAGAGSLDNTFVFKIPVYENMPQTPCEKPEYATHMVLEVPEGYTDLQVYLDGEPVTAVKRNGYYVAQAQDNLAKSAVIYRYNENNVPIGMAVWELKHDGSGYAAKEMEGMRDLLTYHGFSIRITGRSGLRFKSGISQETKTFLMTEGIQGYTLKEYGTLLIPKAKLGDSFLTQSTEKVASGLSYGKDAEGNPVDKVLEQVDGRDRFASVLVGLPVSQYKTEFAFRSYIILSKEGEELVLYGPQNARSIYGLAKQVIEAGAYPEGSSSDVFLKQLIADADAYVEPKEPEEPSEPEGPSEPGESGEEEPQEPSKGSTDTEKEEEQKDIENEEV